MATEKLLNTDTRVAGEDLIDAQYLFVVLDANEAAILCPAGGPAYGVLQNDPGTGEAATIAIVGSVAKIVYGDTVAPNDLLVSDGDSEAIPGVIVVNGNATNVAAQAGDWIIGTARIGGVDGDIGEIQINANGVVPT